MVTGQAISKPIEHEEYIVKKYRERATKGKNVRACQTELAAALKILLRQMKKNFPGVWRATAIDDLEVIAEELPLMAEKGIDARILMWWQPMLPEAPPPEEIEVIVEGWLDTDDVFHAFHDEDVAWRQGCTQCQETLRQTGSPLCPACLAELREAEKIGR